MRKKDKQVVWGIVLGFVWVAVSAFISGCVPLVTGLKEVENGKETTTYRFITGADFHLGANGVDRVEDKRGIQPREK